MIPIEHIHPMIVHFPIVLIILVSAYDAWATIRGRSVSGRTNTGNTTTLLLAMTALTSFLAIMFGDIALEYAEDAGFHSEIAEIHEHLGMLAALLLGTWAAIRLYLWFRDIQLARGLNILASLVSITLSVLVMVTAYFGGGLVYYLGVNVNKVAGGG